jgi:hypothetical protein
MSSKTLYLFCCMDDEVSALQILETFDDLDILYDDGAIVRLVVAKNNTTLLKASLDYFEHKQFSDKGEKYKEAHNKLIEILEESSDGTDSSSAVHSLISEYIGSDIGRLSDVYDAEELALLRQEANNHAGTLTTLSLQTLLQQKQPEDHSELLLAVSHMSSVLGDAAHHSGDAAV